MAPIRRLVLDMLKPHDPTIHEVAARLADDEGVTGVNATLLETDRDVENVKLTIEGEAIDVPAVVEAIEQLGATLHSVDEVASGERIIEEAKTPQDRRWR